MLEFALLCFVSMFTMVNPLGTVPIYTAFTGDLPAKDSRIVAFKASLTAFIILIVFAVTGQLIFDFFSITVNSLKIVGGLIFLSMGWEMLQAKINRQRDTNESKEEFVDDIALTPLGIPMLCGPGAITNAIILMNTHSTIAYKSIFVAMLTLVMVIAFTMLIFGKRILAVLGSSGNKIMMRLMGLIVMVIAVEFFFAGLKPILQEILKLN